MSTVFVALLRASGKYCQVPSTLRSQEHTLLGSGWHRAENVAPELSQGELDFVQWVAAALTSPRAN